MLSLWQWLPMEVRSLCISRCRVTPTRLIHAGVPEAAEILELGCGVGRVTRPLAKFGHAVTGVGNSREMLAAFPREAGIETVLSDVESLDLGRRFRVVLLASHLIDAEDGSLFLQAATRHVTDDGVVLVQRHVPGWVDNAEPMVAEGHDVRFDLTDVSHPESGVVAATAVYTVAGITYRQPFVAFDVDDGRLAHLAGQVGLRIAGYVGDDPSWVKLVPVSSSGG